MNSHDCERCDKRNLQRDDWDFSYDPLMKDVWNFQIFDRTLGKEALPRPDPICNINRRVEPPTSLRFVGPQSSLAWVDDVVQTRLDDIRRGQVSNQDWYVQYLYVLAEE